MYSYDFKDVLLSLNQKRIGTMAGSPVALHVVIVNRPAPPVECRERDHEERARPTDRTAECKQGNEIVASTNSWHPLVFLWASQRLFSAKMAPLPPVAVDEIIDELF